ncbi:MAG TPA: LpqB family beta-propeller domain-containing protein [Thermoanaerobaculia bacterium]|nr:LpqB family beta-propeller domain-containing protein [Thermoanaerobaculia bacterium]
MPLEPQSMLGPYQIVSIIGEGGMGQVYRARDSRLGREVAIKVLTGITINDPDRLRRFEQEARAAGMLNHPNLLTIFDVGNSEGTAYIVSELLEGMTLRDRLEKGPLPPRRAVDAASQIAQGLAAAHEKGIVHRDLKPENIFLTRDGRAKILDFGIAKLNPKTAGEGPTLQMATTEPGMVMGTVGYMSPEQVRGEAVDARSDIFAFGAIVYEMLTGVRAFKRNSSIETLSAILREEPPDILETHPNVPASLERLVRRCLEKDRELRIQSARDLAFNLETLANVSSPSTLSGVALPTGGAPSLSDPMHARTGSHLSTASQPAALHTGQSPTRRQPVAVPTPGSAPRARTAVHPAYKPPRRLSPILLALFYVVSVAGAGFAGYWLSLRMNARGELAFHRITFRRGEVRGARFSPDGDTIVYSAAWEGSPSEIFVTNRKSPEARPLGVPDCEVTAVARSTELAIILHRDRLSGLGTLARVPLAGGTPREVAEQVLQADWSPDGAELAVIRFAGGKFRVEYPIGSVRYETPHFIHDLRVAPDGVRLAFIEPQSGGNDVAVIDHAAPVSVAHGWTHGATGLAWRPDGKEIWVTGTDTGAPPALYAVPLDGEPRLVTRLTGSLRLYDISAAGRVLVSNGMWRAALHDQAPGDPNGERDASWLDWSVLADLSRDGRTILFNETREGGGVNNGVYLRRVDPPAPVRIGDGFGDALSPDGKYVLSHAPGGKLMLLPTGSGEARELKVKGAFDPGAAWLPDQRRVVIAGVVASKGYQLHLLDTLDETLTPISPENIWGEAFRPFAVSPDGRIVAGMTAEQTIALYPIDGGAGTPLPGAQKGEIPIQWTAAGNALYVANPTTVPARVFRIDTTSGARELWREFKPSDPAGVSRIAPICMTPDASAYAYNALRTMSDLYVVEGLR